MTKYELPLKIVHGFDFPDDMPEDAVRENIRKRP